ncbi:nucleotidyltransferase domain-containing protein [Prosthecomicrobium pneumaticum]|uniref:Nucleotidyltransferase n=1 Tax=Prosthecomicrobium pneumaticum TaxID=81895 RepID=A0A7W9FMV2_9HYPH|nr:nucleotidyltransferase domain-containing protein [Prosthecomicrobium pneumaticum]MBB5753604.1 hypothetical protein [Prosthecomicrobium pneumaticum]
MRTLNASFDPAVVARIDQRLAGIENAENVDILLAIESGSRAWGFPSPDSDYDCRFIYRRELKDYLRLDPLRDVIETPLDAVLDVNGWDLAKFLKLLLKGNAVAVEWLMAPFVYGGQPGFRAEALELARSVVTQAATARHYLHLGESIWRPSKDGTMPLKRVFYALRPAVALCWLSERPGVAVAPMHFPTLLRETGSAVLIRDEAEELVARKAVTRELGTGPVPTAIARFIDGAFERGRERWSGGAPRPLADAVRSTDDFFRRWIQADQMEPDNQDVR